MPGQVPKPGMPTVRAHPPEPVRRPAVGKPPQSSTSVPARPRSGRGALSRKLALAGLGIALVAAGALAGATGTQLGGSSPQALSHAKYDKDVSSAVQGLSLVFGQADESIKSFQAGWLAPEGAASEFSFLRDQVKDIKVDIAKAQPPANMEDFHAQLGRSVTLTQQAMDAMQAGFSSGDASYFDLAHQKLNAARQVLTSAVDSL